jgi:hypothetical protein
VGTAEEGAVAADSSHFRASQGSAGNVTDSDTSSYTPEQSVLVECARGARCRRLVACLEEHSLLTQGCMSKVRCSISMPLMIAVAQKLLGQR